MVQFPRFTIYQQRFPAHDFPIPRHYDFHDSLDSRFSRAIHRLHPVYARATDRAGLKRRRARRARAEVAAREQKNVGGPETNEQTPPPHTHAYSAQKRAKSHKKHTKSTNKHTRVHKHVSERIRADTKHASIKCTRTNARTNAKTQTHEPTHEQTNVRKQAGARGERGFRGEGFHSKTREAAGGRRT